MTAARLDAQQVKPLEFEEVGEVDERAKTVEFDQFKKAAPPTVTHHTPEHMAVSPPIRAATVPLTAARLNLIDRAALDMTRDLLVALGLPWLTPARAREVGAAARAGAVAALGGTE
ncbi:hypothetical protein GO986_16490 [Deinococcus sp. HMF7620]|uniref:Uncharacterized protein n=1 Tax=Deinococcus arboris TaxID=2682977 RepID=A0A7C9M852_9DEIO|nr:hypothetical protein [Deinococcus arboris]MVN88345.1 hypothetical protein [Deinococcus arboris]